MKIKQTNGKHILHSCIGRIDIVKMPIVPKTFYTFSAVPSKIPLAFFRDLKQGILKYLWKHKESWIVKRILRKKVPGGATLRNFKLYFKPTVIKWNWHKYRHLRQCKRMESPEINPYIYGQLNYNIVLYTCVDILWKW